MSKDVPLFENLEQYEKISDATPRKRQASRREKAMTVPEETIRDVFSHWEALCTSSRGPKPVYSVDRRMTIGAAVVDYGVELCKQAILGCSLSNWHMGQNPGGKKYNSLELIFRNADNVERFAGMAVAEETKGGFLDEE